MIDPTDPGYYWARPVSTVDGKEPPMEPVLVKNEEEFLFVQRIGSNAHFALALFTAWQGPFEFQP
jgi:hypothetical protein